ncbi:hypothetical protein KEM52_004031, partial [Ascosphaera acerosa]
DATVIAIAIAIASRTVPELQITDDAGTLQWLPFSRCSETGKPLTLSYGVSETVNCTLDAVTDELYHILEYYVHHDVPLSCRVPSVPETSGGSAQDGDGSASNAGTRPGTSSPYTPLTLALQGTLQYSHIHVWTNVNLLVHHGQVAVATGARPGPGPSGEDERETSKQKKRSTSRKKGTGKGHFEAGQILAATAYSVPSVSAPASGEPLQPLPRDLWAAGHGTKVIRGEPLTLTFNVHWLDAPDLLVPAGAAGAGAPTRARAAPHHVVLTTMMYMIVAALVGATVAVWWERNVGLGRMRWS